MEARQPISGELLEEFRIILKEEYGLEPSQEEAEDMAQNILNYYRTLERFSNEIP
jgi:hypothetical protein